MIIHIFLTITLDNIIERNTIRKLHSKNKKKSKENEKKFDSNNKNKLINTSKKKRNKILFVTNKLVSIMIL